MTEFQRLFLVQARSDYKVFELLRREPSLPDCHALHYLQMATEMLGKAYLWRHGHCATSHRAFVSFLRSLSTNRAAQLQLGFQGRNENWQHSIRKSIPLAERIEDLAPKLAGEGPNPEYPWPPIAPQTAPAEYVFEVWKVLVDESAGRIFLNFAKHLFAEAHIFL